MTFSERTPARHSVSAIYLINNALLKPTHRATQDDRTASASACIREMWQAPKSGDISLLAPGAYAIGADIESHLCATSMLSAPRALQCLVAGKAKAKSIRRAVRAGVYGNRAGRRAYECMCVCVYISLSLSLSLYIYIYACMYIYIYIYRPPGPRLRGDRARGGAGRCLLHVKYIYTCLRYVFSICHLYYMSFLYT